MLFKSDRMYAHNIMRINYTTYDVRRAQDVINPSSSHNNIMILADASDSPAHPFVYGRVLGIFHVNVVYIGPGMVNYQPIRMEFLWVRWYDVIEVNNSGWGPRKLDRLKFRRMACPDAFGFVDPSDVLRGCHIAPRFREGKLHLDGYGLSARARDLSDWREYYANR